MSCAMIHSLKMHGQLSKGAKGFDFDVRVSEDECLTWEFRV